MSLQTLISEVENLVISRKGGAGSGNRGHAGIPGKRGGSAPSGASSVSMNSVSDLVSKFKTPNRMEKIEPGYHSFAIRRGMESRLRSELGKVGFRGTNNTLINQKKGIQVSIATEHYGGDTQSTKVEVFDLNLNEQ